MKLPLCEQNMSSDVEIIALENAEVAGRVERVRFFPQISPAVLSQNLIFIQSTNFIAL